MGISRSTSLQEAAALAAAALSDLEALRIEQTPEHYTVWYHYHAKTDPALVHAIDILRDSSQTIDSQRCGELYQQYFVEEGNGARVTAATGRLALELGGLVEQLGIAGQDAAEYGSQLESFGVKLSSTGGAGGIADVVTSMLAATRAMEDRNRELEEKLNVSSRQIGALKDELDEMTRAALTDALTGIANRKLFDVEFERAAAECDAESQAMCLLVIDIDFFKRFNDTFGHAVGDQVLKLLALTLRESIKGRDTAARYGGEEFVILLPETDLDSAARLAEVIRGNIRKKRIINRSTGQDMGEITVSIGVGLHVPGEPLEPLFNRADAALYQAKETGRNRVVTEEMLARQPVASSG